MKRLRTIFALCLWGFAGGLFAADIATVAVSGVSDYVFRAADVSASGKNFPVKPALQPSIDFNLGDGWNFNYWSSYFLVDRNAAYPLREVDEIDLTFSKTKSFKHVEFTAGGIGYFYPNARTTTDYEVFIGLSFPTNFGLTPSLTNYGNVVDNAIYTVLALSYELKGFSAGASVGLLYPEFQSLTQKTINDISFTLGYSYDIGQASVGLSINGSYLPGVEKTPAQSNLILWTGLTVGYAIKG